MRKYNKDNISKRPLSEEPGVPRTTVDHTRDADVEKGSAKLLFALMDSHPRIVDYLIRKNGMGDGRLSLPE